MGEQVSLIYLYGFSTLLESKLITLFQILKNQVNQNAQISIVFIHDGVIGTALKNKISPAMEELLKLPLSFFTLIPDLKARGLDFKNLQNNIKGIEYEDLVDLLVVTSKIVSWM
ncbi:MAG: DsrH/TusB family sulfur metabolism protein [Promethearchaeota archaeon]